MKGIDKKGWTKISLGEACRNVNETIRNPVEAGIERYIGLEHIEPGNLHISTWGSVSDGTTFTKRFTAGQVLFGKRRAYQKKSALADFDGICSGDILVLEANDQVIDKNLFPFLISSDRFFDYAVQTSAGSLSPRTKFQDLAKFEFLIPPRNQQAKLAALLWAANDVIEQYKTLSALTENALKSAYNLYFVKSNVEMIPLGSLAEVIMGQSPDGSTYNSTGEGTPLLNGPTEFTDRYPVRVQWTTNPSKLCKEGDLLLCVRGSTTGRMNIANDVYCIGRGIAAIRGSKNYTTNFLEHVLTYYVLEIIKLAVGSTFPNIDRKSLKSINIPKYSLNEQNEIVRRFNLLVTNKSSLSTIQNQSEKIKKQIINQIFST
jgi:type I restriction enzyme, S subunit